MQNHLDPRRRKPVRNVQEREMRDLGEIAQVGGIWKKLCKMVEFWSGHTQVSGGDEKKKPLDKVVISLPWNNHSARYWAKWLLSPWDGLISLY